MGLIFKGAVSHRAVADEKDELSLNLLLGESTASESAAGGCLSRQAGAELARLRLQRYSSVWTL